MADFINETLEAAQNATEKPKASTEGMLIAYSSLVIMAMLPIFFGSFRSVKFLKKQKDSGEKPETMSKKDAAMFPLIASGALLGLYIFFKCFPGFFEFLPLSWKKPVSSERNPTLHPWYIPPLVFSKEYINLLVTLYFFGLGVLALAHILSPIVSNFLPAGYESYHHIVYTKGSQEKKEELINFPFSTADLIALGLCALIGGVYLWNKHWVVNNIFGLAFALNGVEFLHLNNIVIGCTLLGGLFIYDIFWVFATDVMVTVAKSFEAPIKLVFPQDILENWLESKNFAMLGLGDVVIPGIFIALLLRFDYSLKRNQKLYFYSSFIAYFLGLVLTIFIMSYFKHAQPALLYLVPACIGVPGLVALVKGDMNALITYADHPEEELAAGDSSTKEEDKKEN